MSENKIFGKSNVTRRRKNKVKTFACKHFYRGTRIDAQSRLKEHTQRNNICGKHIHKQTHYVNTQSDKTKQHIHTHNLNRLKNYTKPPICFF